MKKYALITGASGGIGAATAFKLAHEGWNLYLHYYRNETNILELIEKLKVFNIELIPICADLTTEEGIHQVCNSVLNLNAIVYSSGVAPYGLFTDLSEQTIDDMLQLHVKSPLIIVQKLLPKLMKYPESSIVLISSIWGQTGSACEVMYSTVKGAQISFMKAISKEIARSGTRVNCVAPGAVKTNMLNGFSEEELDVLESEIPIGRLAEPKEIADVISFLLSKDSSYITGQVIGVNGGWYT
ncbi:elongation factor P 5-aminopentanone reductase [Lederbergia wuyishanensis]|uniref:3-oxoacyl-[acyl-carrier protein] reductase n=1 Tax=Lederbergia wuyishanensis TaxID=1347903 RepID=A0ABU0CZW3_9BACI|nr:SDR family oxidoreductase [Lederbergia wuyishanensis]MCJ8006332.1 SDR family oxidoreductase [Lederbergia wuyishanensis]MDQ0341701.1 3-oxoacyl-[acyl-carrier protein] reductase [Lederbergia wuyishanensis]